MNLRQTESQPRITVELTNTCNLHCSYCLREEEALHRAAAQWFPVELLIRAARGARTAFGATTVSFTGGEATLHPRFREILAAVAAEGMKSAFVTNGWHFARVWPALLEHRHSLAAVAFSVDGATREAHDRWRGAGSFVRIVQAMTLCASESIPFLVKAPIRKDTLASLEAIALFAARMGAAALHFTHLLPTSQEQQDSLGLSRAEQAVAEHEIGALSAILRMPIGVAVGFYDLDPRPPCTALSATSCNIDYRGRMTLCCNLSGFEGAHGSDDVVADLTAEEFEPAFARLRARAAGQTAQRAHVLAEFQRRGEAPPLEVGSPCLFCLRTFAKTPWMAAP